MGKKSKKKGGGKARKERLQKRQEQRLEDLGDLPGEQQPPPPREFYEGDRVWFGKSSTWGDGANPDNYRGYVRRVREDSLDIVPLQSEIDGTDDWVRVSRKACSEDFVFPDFRDFTLRFELGERVLCGSGTWQPSEIYFLWPVMEIFNEGLPVPQGPGDVVPTYKCIRDGDPGPRPPPAAERRPRDGSTFIWAPDDTDSYVRRRPCHPFRLEVGDPVVFDARWARSGPEAPRAQRSADDPWLEGTIVLVDVPGGEGYAAYECSVGKLLYYVFVDDDERIARSNANPRERLFEAIEQHCSRWHLKYLTQTFQIDVSTFRDLVVQRSIQAASYHALLWLEKDCGIEVLHMNDSDENNILHRIAATLHASDFIREAKRMENIDEKLHFNDTRLTCGLNNMGQTWLDILVQRGDTKALDVALSRRVGFGWEMQCLQGIKRALLESSITESGNVIMKCIFDSFVSFQNLMEQYSSFRYDSEHTEDELLKKESMAVFRGDSALQHAKLLTRFISDWRGCTDRVSSFPLLRLVERGFSKLFKLFFEANKNMFLEKDVYPTWSNEDRNDYIQPELAPHMEDCSSYECIYVDLFTACIMRNGAMGSSTVDKGCRWLYLSRVMDHCMLYHRQIEDGSCDHNYFASWYKYLQDMIKVYSSPGMYSYKEHLEERIKVLEDGENLNGRIEILEHVLNHNRARVDVLEALCQRQCWVLRFMVGKNLLKLQAIASSNEEFKNRASELQFLDNGCVPNISTQSLLCFAAVQYDDLQSLQWLCDASPLSNESCNGWNLMHFAAFVGRVEIIALLSTQSAWQSLVSEICCRKQFQNARAVHIAVIQGHLKAADLMLALQAPATDGKHKMPEQWARKSKHKFVREWGLARERPQALERDVKKLLHLIDADDTTSERLEEFIIKSKCLDTEVWCDCGHVHFDSRGPLGYSIGDILRKCCGQSLDQDFIFRLLATLYFEQSYRFSWQPKDGYDESQHPVKEMTWKDLIAFAEHEGYVDIAGYLRKAFCKEISCRDPAMEHFLLNSAICEQENKELLLKIRAKLLRVTLLKEILSLNARAIRDHLKRGCSPEMLDEVFQIGVNVKKAFINEGYNSEFDKIHSYLLKQTDMTGNICVDYVNSHPLFKQIQFQGHSRSYLGTPNIILATEGFHQLLEYCLRNWEGWTAKMETETVQIAAFFGHASIVDLFLSADTTFVSDTNDRAQATILGAGEACRCRDLSCLLARHGSVSDPVKEKTPPDDKSTAQTYMAQSLMCSVLNGYIRGLYDSSIDDRKAMKTLKLIVNELGYNHDEILCAISLLLNYNGWGKEWAANIVNLLQAVTEALRLQLAVHVDQLCLICKDMVKFFVGAEAMLQEKEEESYPRVVLNWIENLALNGVPLENILPSDNMFMFMQFPKMKLFADECEKIKQGQLQLWSQFDCVKNEQPLKEIQNSINRGTLDFNCCDRGGANLTHISASYNRVDLLEWLVVAKKMDLLSKDAEVSQIL